MTRYFHFNFPLHPRYDVSAVPVAAAAVEMALTIHRLASIAAAAATGGAELSSSLSSTTGQPPASVKCRGLVEEQKL